MTDQPKPFRPAEGRPHIAALLARHLVEDLEWILAEGDVVRAAVRLHLRRRAARSWRKVRAS